MRSRLWLSTRRGGEWKPQHQGTFTGGAVDGTATAVSLGATVGGGSQFFNGSLDEVAVYKHALTPSEVTAHSSRGKNGPVATATTSYLLGGLVERTSAGAISLFDVDGPAGDLAHYTTAPTTGSTSLSFAFYDGHGDLAAETSPAGTTTATYTSDPFGAPLQGLPTGQTSERFTGRWDKKLDPADNLIEMGARPYDPTLGRFLAVDPIDGGSATTYDYAVQDPVNGFDLDGTFCSRCKKAFNAVSKGITKYKVDILVAGGAILVCVGTAGVGCTVALAIATGVSGVGAFSRNGIGTSAPNNWKGFTIDQSLNVGAGAASGAAVRAAAGKAFVLGPRESVWNSNVAYSVKRFNQLVSGLFSFVSDTE